MRKEEFSQHIIDLVDSHGISQKKISEKTGFSRTVISHAYNRNYNKFAVRADMPPKLFEAFPELKDPDLIDPSILQTHTREQLDALFAEKIDLIEKLYNERIKALEGDKERQQQLIDELLEIIKSSK